MLIYGKNIIYFSGNGTVGLEILEDLPDVDAVIVPYGGGSLCTGIASVFKQVKPSVKIYACEEESATPVTASLKAGMPSKSVHYRPSFVDGMNGEAMLSDMWNLVNNLVTATTVVSLQETVDAMKLLVRKNCVVSEGAGAAAVAAALKDRRITGNVVCVVTGGKIDTDKLICALNGQIPQV